jgi:hypothetical protein
MDPYFAQAALHGLSEGLTNAHKQILEKQTTEEMADRKVFAELLKSSNPEVQRLGLAGLLEKRGRGWFGKLRESQTMPQVDALLNRVGKPTSAAPPPKKDAAAQVASSPTQGGTMNLTPGVETPEGKDLGPPPAPGYSMTDPSNTGGMEPIEDIQARMTAPPPEPPAQAGDYHTRLRAARERVDPLGFNTMSPMQEKLLQAEALGLDESRIRELGEQELFPTAAKLDASRDLETTKQQNRLELMRSKRGIEIDQATAQRLGIEPGLIDVDLYKQLEQNGRTQDVIAGRRANASLMRQNYNLRFFPTSDGSAIMTVDPRTGQTVGSIEGARTTPPSATEEASVTSKKMMLEDAQKVRELIKGNESLIGFATGKLQNLATAFDQGDPTWVTLDDTLNRMRTGQLYELTGKAAAAWEREGIGRMVPQLDSFMSSPQKFMQQLDGYERKVKQFLSTYREGTRAPDVSPPPARPGATPVRKRYNPATGKIE